MDETTVQMLQEEGRTPQTKSYMWVRVGGTEQQPAILFLLCTQPGYTGIRTNLIL